MELSPIVLIIWGELTFLMAGGLALLLINRMVAQGKGKKSVKELMEKIKADREARKMEIRKGLAAYGLEEDVLEAKVTEIDKRERKFYQRIATMYQKRSDAMLATLNVALEGTTKPYYELDMKLEAPPEQPAEEQHAGIEPAEMEALQKKNEELQNELAVTMETIGRMLSEYSSMFGSEEDEGLDKDKIMEAFEVDESSEASESETDAGAVEEVEEVEVVSELTQDDADDDLEIVTELDAEESAAEPATTAEDDLDVDALFESAQSDAEEKADKADVSEDDIDDILSDGAVPDDELLEIGDEPMLTTTLDDKEGEILSELVDLEADFGDGVSAEKGTDDAGSVESAQTDAIDDLDIDALLNDNKN
ncbi:MAG: hypothetical protein HKP55_13475 [Gammaproteobacteria bacterium]|nr:hypothetical protein [Gammaproteobacteria bacterium]